MYRIVCARAHIPDDLGFFQSAASAAVTQTDAKEEDDDDDLRAEAAKPEVELEQVWECGACGAQTPVSLVGIELAAIGAQLETAVSARRVCESIATHARTHRTHGTRTQTTHPQTTDIQIQTQTDI